MLRPEDESRSGEVPEMELKQILTRHKHPATSIAIITILITTIITTTVEGRRKEACRCYSKCLKFGCRQGSVFAMRKWQKTTEIHTGTGVKDFNRHGRR